ncbi:MAG: Hsp20/alpha crystallin family protein [Anaerolineae bacterium]|nr:Hsp20/alpha crystallin family protein [Anaerolineae bacterium]
MARLVRWTPTNTLERTMDRLFEDFWRTAQPASGGAAFARPPLDVVTYEDHTLVRVDLPGVRAEDVNLEIKDGILTISTQVNSDEPHASANYTYRERYNGSYQRSLRLPETLDAANAEAQFENGVLSLRLPHKPEARSQRIPVKGAAQPNGKGR